GDDNIFIFGMRANEVADMWGRGYNSTDFYFKQPKLRQIVEDLNKGFAGESFESISRYLLRNGQFADPYMCFGDFASYMAITDKMDKCYKDTNLWNKMSLKNIAEAGRFSADRAVKEYAEKIWRM
ncbi:MAG: glycogen/starch/alpha-glucan phosphorylase, partial [Clostridia bacterium]|nr:glycogen/starch/alpha-glucan phosphorylase [Clostridia bacterium]